VSQTLPLSEGRIVLAQWGKSRIKDPSQIVKIIRFTVASPKPRFAETLKATLAVLGLHLVRYLYGVGHPPGCEDMVSNFSPAKQQELALLKPEVLRANLFLRVVSEYEYMPMDVDFHLDVSGAMDYRPAS
jgi:hypothetical protein